MDINSDCVDNCATNCPPSANLWVLPSHSQGLAVIHKVLETLLSQKNPNYEARMSPACPDHRLECSHGKPDINGLRYHQQLSPRHSLQCPQEIHGILDGFQPYPWKREGLCKTPICTSDKFLKWRSSDYLGFRGFITALPTLSDFFLICSSSLLPPIAEYFPSFQHVPPSKLIRFVFNVLLMAVIRFHLKNFLQYWEMCTDKIHSVRRPKRRRMPRKGSPSAVLSCGDQPLVWSRKNITEGMSWQAASKENISWPLRSVQVAEMKLQY